MFDYRLEDAGISNTNDDDDEEDENKQVAPGALGDRPWPGSALLGASHSPGCQVPDWGVVVFSQGSPQPRELLL